MNLAVYNITLDINKTGSQVFLPMRRGDTGRKIVASLCENGIPYKLEGCDGVFTALKADGKYINNDCVVDVENNVIIYPVTLQTTAAEGMVNCQIKLIGKNGKVIATPEFGIIVEKTVYNEECIVESSEEFAALTKLYAETYALKTEIETKLANGDLKGDTGEKGEKGDKGDKGEKGDKGDKGDPGEAPSDSVLYTEQTLNEEQKTQARKNIDALGAVEVVTDTIYAKEDDVIVGYIKPDGTHSETTAYRCTKYIPINFDDNDSVDIRCSFIGYAGAVFFDIDKNVLLSVNGNNIADYGFAASSEPQTATITLPDGAVFVRSAIAADYYTKPEDFWISGKKTYDIIDLLEGASSTIINKSAVLYEKQALTNEQKAQARENIGAVGIETFEVEMGILSDVLDELHNYAQALIGGEA